MRPLLRFEQVTCRRGGRLLFDDLDFELAAGEALLVTGPNGSGKSSLIRLAAGLLRPQSGNVERGAAALADENLALDRELPLFDALLFWAKLDSSSDKLASSLNALAISHLSQVPVRLLSAGQLKRATLARTAASGAPLWLIDEPLNGLDSEGVERLGTVIARHRDAGGAVMAASHAELKGHWRRLELGR